MVTKAAYLAIHLEMDSYIPLKCFVSAPFMLKHITSYFHLFKYPSSCFMFWSFGFHWTGILGGGVGNAYPAVTGVGGKKLKIKEYY